MSKVRRRRAASVVAAVVAFAAGSAYAFAQRGSLAVGGEFMLLFLIPAAVEFVAYAKEHERRNG